MFYVNGTKCVPKNISNMLTARSVAYWFMDDGSKTKRGYKLSSHGFLKEDSEILIVVFELKFAIICNLYRDGEHFYIDIGVRYAEAFKQLILPYMHTSMLYKLHT